MVLLDFFQFKKFIYLLVLDAWTLLTKCGQFLLLSYVDYWGSVQLLQLKITQKLKILKKISPSGRLLDYLKQDAKFYVFWPGSFSITVHTDMVFYYYLNVEKF